MLSRNENKEKNKSVLLLNSNGIIKKFWAKNWMTNEKNLYLYIPLKYYFISKNILNRIELVKTKIKLIIAKNKKEQKKEQNKIKQTFTLNLLFSLFCFLSQI